MSITWGKSSGRVDWVTVAAWVSAGLIALAWARLVVLGVEWVIERWAK